MPRFIVKIKDSYLEWSTIVDCPVTFGMDRDRFEEYYRWRYGEDGMRDFYQRMARVDEKGTSVFDHESAEDTVRFNHAGPQESELTIDEIYRAYCENEPVDGWQIIEGKWTFLVEK